MNVCKELFAILQANIASIEEDEADDQDEDHTQPSAADTQRRRPTREQAA
jgi:hypothetical protein